MATISPVEDRKQLKHCHFRELFACDEFEAAQSRENVARVKESTADLLATSRVMVLGATAAIHDMRQTVTSTTSTIKKSQELITRTERVIDRWKRLGCKD